MDYVAVPQSHWSPLHDLAENATAIDEKCHKIVGLIKEAFERKSLIGEGVCSLEIVGADNEFATLKSPIGSGRIIRTWSHSQRNLQAELTFARERLDEYGRQYWEPVWGLVVPRYDAAYSGTGMDALRFEIGSFMDDARHKAFSSAIAMLYGLLSGPLIESIQ